MQDIPIKSRKRQVLLSLIFTYANIGLMLVQGFVLTPIYLRYVSKDLFGGWMATGNVLAWVQLIDPGLSKVLQQRVAHAFGAKDYAGLPAIIGSGVFLGFLLSIGPLLVLPFGGAIAGTIDLASDEVRTLAQAVGWGLVSTALVLASYQPAAANLSLQLVTPAGVIYLVAGVANIAVTLGLLLAGWGLVALPLGMVVRGFLLLVGNGAILAWWTRRRLRRRLAVTREECRNYGALVSVTFIERVGATLIAHLDAYLAARIISPAAAASYAITSRAFEPVRLASERFGLVMLPGLAHLIGEGKRDRVVDVSERLLGVAAYVASVGAAGVVALNFVFVPLWIKGTDLYAGQSVTVILAAAVVINVIAGAMSDVLFALGGIRSTAIVRLVEGAVRLAAQTVLAYRFGLVGLAAGAALGTLVVCGFALPRLLARYFERAEGSQYRAALGLFAHCALVVALGLGAYFACRAAPWHWTWPIFAAAAAVIAAVIGVAGLLIHRSVQREARAVLARVRDRFGRR